MPFFIPFIIAGAVVGAASLGSTVHSTLKTRKWQRLHNEALENAQATDQRVQDLSKQFNREAESLGKLRVGELETLQRAATFIKDAEVKDRDLSPQYAKIPQSEIERWQGLYSEAKKSLGIGVLGAAGATGAGSAAPAGLYAAAGIFGVASTGVRIATLSGAAAHSARLAWLGGGALAAGGAGIAGGMASMFAAVNIVAAPIGIATAAWGQWKAHKVQQEVEGKLREFAAFETKMASKESMMLTGRKRIEENRIAISRTAATLKQSLATAKQGDESEAYAVYLKAKALSECLGATVLSEAQVRQLNS